MCGQKTGNVCGGKHWLSEGHTSCEGPHEKVERRSAPACKPNRRAMLAPFFPAQLTNFHRKQMAGLA